MCVYACVRACVRACVCEWSAYEVIVPGHCCLLNRARACVLTVCGCTWLRRCGGLEARDPRQLPLPSEHTHHRHRHRHRPDLTCKGVSAPMHTSLSALSALSALLALQAQHGAAGAGATMLPTAACVSAHVHSFVHLRVTMGTAAHVRASTVGKQKRPPLSLLPALPAVTVHALRDTGACCWCKCWCCSDYCRQKLAACNEISIMQQHRHTEVKYSAKIFLRLSLGYLFFKSMPVKKNYR